MGDEVVDTTFSRENRQAYRDKVKLCLDVFARMLAESRFDPDWRSIGMEIELNLTEEQAQQAHAHMMTIGILPTLTEELLNGEALSANPRYKLLNEQIFAARGEDLEINISGVERLAILADTIAPEAACTSVQLHQMIDPATFGAHWNAAQAISGVQLAVGANSPFFFGRELWCETRIALFE